MRHADDLGPGNRLGTYEILRELATGDTATLYLARVSGTAGFEKLVVLKCIRSDLVVDRDFVATFLDEARIAATMRHANIASVNDVGGDGGTYFFAMEYVRGHDVRAIGIEAARHELPIPLEVSLAIAIGTAAALAYAHGRIGPDGPLQLVHRDVSPSNVMVGFDGAVKLVDFGIARASPRRARTRPGMWRETAAYLSPEQCRGEALDPRSDTFSLGTILYELTTGVRPFRGNGDFEVMEAIATCKPAPPSSLVHDYPRLLEQIVLCMLAPRPDARYQTAQLVVEALEVFVARNRMLTSASVVAKYMQKLFSEHATMTLALPGDPQTSDTREYARGAPPTGLIELVRDLPPSEEETTAARSQPDAWRSLQTETTSTHRWFLDDPTRSSPFHELTHPDVVLPFDPVDARRDELLALLDRDAPDVETEAARTIRRIETLIYQAQAHAGMGEIEKAVIAVQLALDEQPRTQAAYELLERHVDTIVFAYELLLEDPYRIPTLTRPLRELSALPFDPRVLELLALVDGKATIKDLVESSELQRLEVYHHLCRSLLRGIVR